ncbi:MAG: hypothetical protein A2219_01850 [Elusimicrobia bacterium RIFOXYA2_FULL_50_26]|nr:MAG: hypothetical protein A2219_01850 [Elusimicrobia bacterium RIFOXYA2_FULL_50_26]OGS24003.1 MAG: hypothetical protein A2314_02470 [Elusimicrobia bacterium RIFOXYB2_FULL_50_12]
MSERKVSVYIITFNEEKKIRACLESVTWADEIVVLDSFSTDKTVEICRQFTDKIYQHEFNGFGELRNTALSHVTNDWVLSIDSDERATPELRDEIRARLSGDGPDADAYLVPRKSYFLNHLVKHCGWYPDYRQPQFFNRQKMKYTLQKVHETYILDGKLSRLNGHALQFPFLSMDQFLKKMDRYSALRAGEMFADGKRFRIHHLLVNPAAMFFRMYVAKLGFLDGKVGLILSLLYGYYTMIKYIKLWELVDVTTPKEG